MRILTICPTIRDHTEMSKSWEETIEEDNHLYLVKFGTVTQAINSVLPHIKHFDYVHITNDDVVYKTKGWDTKLILSIPETGGISYGRDNIQNQALCTFPMISRNIIESLGWIQLPALNRYYGDMVWRHIGIACNCLLYNPHVEIDHLWKEDDVDHNIYSQDMLTYINWLEVYSKMDVLKVKEALNGIL